MAPKKKPKKTKGISPRGDVPKQVPVPRLKAVEDWLAQGLDYCEVVKLDVTMHQVSNRTAKRDIAAIYAKWEKEEPNERPARRQQARQFLSGLVERALAAVAPQKRMVGVNAMTGEPVMEDWQPTPKDLLDVAKIHERLCKLDGLDAPEKVDVKHSDALTEQVLGMTPAEREKEIAALIAKRMAGGGRA